MKKILTIILDGFGMREDIYGNAIKNAGMNNFINIWNTYPHCLLKSAGTSIGLKKGECGSSEVGHKVIGAGRKIKSRNTALEEALEKKEFLRLPKYREMINYANQTEKNIHLLICLSDGGVSSDIKHLKKIINKLQEEKLSNTIYIHAIADGIDTSKKKIYEYIKDIQDILNDKIRLATVCGRYYAMDKTKDTKRAKVFYNLLARGEGVEATDLKKVIDFCYEKQITDEYLPPLKTSSYAPLKPNDLVLFLNTSKDNNKEILELLEKGSQGGNLKLKIYSLFEISRKINKNYLLKSPKINNSLGEYLSNLGLTQARISEQIKKESITYYLNGEKKINDEHIDTYVIRTPLVEKLDEKPELSTLTIAKTIIKCMEQDYDFIVANFANPDAIGHTGNYQATINGLQAIDVCLGKIIEVAQDNFYKVILVGSHGKADTIINRKNEMVCQNTLSPVPFVILDKKVELENGDLTGVAPTILKYMDIKLPNEMKETEDLFKKE